MDMIECPSRSHCPAFSIYPRCEVPRDLFMHPFNGTIYKTCADCRKAKATSYAKSISEKKRKFIEKSDGDKIPCSKCYTELSITSEYALCLTCRLEHRERSANVRGIYKQIMLERIREMGCCCNICKNVFIKNPYGAGFLLVDSLEGVADNDIELGNLEADHLTESEQMLMFGKNYGAKKQKVSAMRSEKSLRYEFNKCQLLCLLCHCKETQRRRRKISIDDDDSTQWSAKRRFVKMVKLDLECCEICHFPVDDTLLSYHEFDHLDPQHKKADIALMMWNSKYNINDINMEIRVCRMICRFCHRQHTKTTRIIKE